MVNIDRLKQTKELLRTEKAKQNFNMNTFFNLPTTADVEDSWRAPVNACGTASCIAGHIIAHVYPTATFDCWADIHIDGTRYNPDNLAADWLELSDQEMYWLFFGRFRANCELDQITIDQAIAAIDYLIAGKPIVIDQQYVAIFDEEGNPSD